MGMSLPPLNMESRWEEWQDLEAWLPQMPVRDRYSLRQKIETARLRPQDFSTRDWAVWREQARAAHLCWQRRRDRLPRPQAGQGLPIHQYREAIIAQLRERPVVIIAGETGSGKSTQLPQYALAAGFGAGGLIGCTQPRRVAATSVSRRVAEELGVEWGREVGCKIRFQDQTTPETVIKFMTDGVLLAELQADPLLLDYEVILIDEAHERSLNIDFLLGYLWKIREKRPDLKIVITSATLDTETFSRAFAAPVLQVSGRMYPVEVIYRPLDHDAEEKGEVSYIESAASVVEEIVRQTFTGDILVFLPGEKDIRELQLLLQGRQYGPMEILPLFGRLANADQQRIFAPSNRRKVVLATNIAETSITIPGIRYVIDTGLARVSRYSAATRTLRLPVEPISISAAEQRKGRCGRVAEGVCYRLYSEQELLARPQYTQPEIQRANLAAVLLRMLAFGLGAIESFPFLHPPSEKAIRGAYQLLRELGALDDGHELTNIGQQLARLPIDPTAARMLLQARQEGSLREVLVIASALSIQDPRERPSEEREAAEEAHRRFQHRESDFLTLLAIWDAMHEDCERMSQKQMRKFCQANFLSYQRMREWRDIHEQLSQALDDMELLQLNTAPAEYQQIHRALLSGLLTQVAEREEGNHYRATQSRRVMLFPGSGLYDRKAAHQEKYGKKRDNERPKVRTPEWIMAGEWMETNRIYARNVARIEPAWVADLGAHLVKSSFSEPGWDKAAGRVLCREKVFLQGLCLLVKKADFARIDPRKAQEIFIRSALIEEELRESPPFLVHNRQVRKKVEESLAKIRRVSTGNIEERLFDFYEAQLHSRQGRYIASLPDLHGLIREEYNGQDHFLRLTEKDLLADPAVLAAAEAFPEEVEIGGRKLELQYVFRPGAEEDGATLRVPVAEFEQVRVGLLDWLVPGWMEEKVLYLLKALPKETRVKLHPLAERVKEILPRLTPGPTPLLEMLETILRDTYGVQVLAGDWRLETVPAHLRPRIEVVDACQRVLAKGRDWHTVEKEFRSRVEETLRAGQGIEKTPLWQGAVARWEKGPLQTWSFGDLPAGLDLGVFAGVPVKAFPGLRWEKDGVWLRLFRYADEAYAATAEGLPRLGAQALGREMMLLQQDLERETKAFRTVLGPFAPTEQWTDIVTQRLLCQWFPVAYPVVLEQTAWEKQLAAARQEIRTAAGQWASQWREVLRWRGEVEKLQEAYPGLTAELAALVPLHTAGGCAYERLKDLPRYLKAMLKRAERYRHNPSKDAEKAARLAPILQKLGHLQKQTAEAPLHRRRQVEELRWWVEEYKISIFAQELGTAFPVSEKKFTQLVEAIVG